MSYFSSGEVHPIGVFFDHTAHAEVGKSVRIDSFILAIQSVGRPSAERS